MTLAVPVPRAPPLGSTTSITVDPQVRLADGRRRGILRGVTDLAQRLEDALELAELAEEIVELRFRRQYPDADAAEVDRLLLAWPRERPSAPHGDAFGRPVTLPRS